MWNLLWGKTERLDRSWGGGRRFAECIDNEMVEFKKLAKRLGRKRGVGDLNGGWLGIHKNHRQYRERGVVRKKGLRKGAKDGDDRD